ncbi:M50 family metallopeptidase [Terracoccus luteus]|uniref:Membrane-associated protease RseP (Regulator of RpoE activity) n=1 Tax=Terracoccus luteus TaxID=53356 RepID=A0A839PQ91_9MICO|nr:site-2 protease family protein [Terracoccus luteus]MBB2985193.1 membrane-associated protease RseP (regulator of RpoE activity) [Terracoccus luteus]MCP2170845.1 membrane-associated protease RseP (regulator of RpoE activity) [Terracoccus luteus]
MLFVLGVLIVFVGVALSIALHEIGHLLPAKKFGVKVTQYMVGFGPTVWSRRRGETEYGVKAIPLGGYVRMIGMLPPRPGDRPGELRELSTGRFSQMVDQARNDSMVEIQPGDEDRVFYKLHPAKKIVIMLGGPMMNLVIAFVLLTGVITLYGLPQVVPKVGLLSSCVPTAAPTLQVPQPKCATGDPQSPAAAGGLKADDRIVSVNGQSISTWDQVTALIRDSAGTPLRLVVQRGDAQVPLTVTPAALQRPTFDAQGQPVTRDGQLVLSRVGFLGVTPAQELVKKPIYDAPAFVWEQTVQTASVVVKIPQKMVGVVQAAFGSGERDPNGPISVVGVGRIGGEVAALDVPADEGGNWLKLAQLVLLIASLNLALFVFNLVPLLPLDGGHVAGALWESVKRAVARLRGRPDPGYVDVAKGLPIAYGMSLVLITMSVLLIYADIVKPIDLFG